MSPLFYDRTHPQKELGLKVVLNVSFPQEKPNSTASGLMYWFHYQLYNAAWHFFSHLGRHYMRGLHPTVYLLLYLEAKLLRSSVCSALYNTPGVVVHSWSPKHCCKIDSK